MTSSLFRLPAGIPALKPGFGRDLRDIRRSEGMTQATLAAAVGVSRESISRIENGAEPRPDTLDAILETLNKNLSILADKGRSSPARRPRFFDGTVRGDYREEMGRAIRTGRKSEGMSLRTLSKKTGFSPSQLSRIERGEGDRSRVYKDHKEDRHLPKPDRRMHLANPELIRLVEVARRLSLMEEDRAP